jgi:hypothetical protein
MQAFQGFNPPHAVAATAAAILPGRRRPRWAISAGAAPSHSLSAPALAWWRRPFPPRDWCETPPLFVHAAQSLASVGMVTSASHILHGVAAGDAHGLLPNGGLCTLSPTLHPPRSAAEPLAGAEQSSTRVRRREHRLRELGCGGVAVGVARFYGAYGHSARLLVRTTSPWAQSVNPA